jgi:hypothetical protein
MTTMIWRLTMVAIVLGAIATLDACTSDGAARPAATVRDQVARVVDDARAADPTAARPRRAGEPDPCDGVDDGAGARVEAKMRHLDGELVVLGGDEMQALACSRSRSGR